MTLAILGTGHIGANLGILLARAGHTVVFGSRTPEAQDTLLAAAPGARVTTPDAAIAAADVVIEALPFGHTLALDAHALASKTLVTAGNYYPDRDGPQEVSPSESEALAAKLPDTTVVKAFNMLYYKELEDRIGGTGTPGATYLIAGDDAEARALAARLAADVGFDTVDVGPLANGVLFQTNASLYAKAQTKAQVEAQLAALRRAA